MDNTYYITDYILNVLSIDYSQHEGLTRGDIKRLDLLVAETIAEFWDCDEYTALQAMKQVRAKHTTEGA